jgi:hypothetical protein
MYTRTNHVNQDEHVVMHSDFTLVDGWDELRILLAKVLRLGQLSLSTQVVISGGKGEDVWQDTVQRLVTFHVYMKA